MKLITESTLSDSFIYGMFNVNKQMTVKIAKAYQSGQILDASYIEEQLLQIKRTHISPLVDSVLSAFERGRIELVYNKLVKIPQPLPFIILKTREKNKAIVFVNNYGTISDKGAVNGGHLLSIPMKDLYVLLEGAYIALSYYDYANRIERSIGLMKFTNSVYTTMMSRILNKEFALSMDPDLFNQISFSISRFYLEKVWGVDNHDIIFNYACQVNLNMIKDSMIIIDDSYTQAGIENVSDLISFIRGISPRLDKLTMRYFTECYINIYRAPALLSMDTLPYFLFTLSATYIGSFIVNQSVISDIVKNTKGANIYYNELSKLV